MVIFHGYVTVYQRVCFFGNKTKQWVYHGDVSWDIYVYITDTIINGV
jgi:hypothetical protein